MRRLFPYLLPLLALLPVDESRATTTWMCGLAEDGVRLVCLSDPDEADEVTTPAPVRTVTVQVRGTQFPLDPRRIWTVDLYAPPSERERVEQLAEATICYRSPGCNVILAPNRYLAPSRTGPRRGRGLAAVM